MRLSYGVVLMCSTSPYLLTSTLVGGKPLNENHIIFYVCFSLLYCMECPWYSSILMELGCEVVFGQVT